MALQSWCCALVLLLLAPVAAQHPTASEGRAKRSAAGYFQVSFTSQLDPLGINRMHSWILHVADAEGSPIAAARISVGGGMPEHDHGLPSQPRLTRALGDGDYLIEGMKFHMHGAWEVAFTISADDVTDTVVFHLEL